MKYTEAWASVASQNSLLKLTISILGLLTLLLGMTTLKLTFKDAILIERGCYSKTVNPGKDEHTKLEIETFLQAALAQRFDSSVKPVDGLVSPDELRLRLTEQKELETRNIKQKIIVNQVTPSSDGNYLVDADRIIYVNDLRSAFRFQLLVKLESKARSQSNPYGLLIVSAKQNETIADPKEKK